VSTYKRLLKNKSVNDLTFVYTGEGPVKVGPPKKKAGGIADRLAAFQKAVQESQ